MTRQQGKFRALLNYTFHRKVEPSETFWKRLKPGLVLVVIVTFTNAACNKAGMYERFEWTDSDKLLRSTLERSENAQKQSVVVVRITDDTYKSRFNNQSPLAAIPLAEIVKGVCLLQPARVGVDIFTGDWQPEQRTKAIETLGSQSNCRVVWIRDSVYEDSEPRKPHFRLGKVLGFATPPNGVCTALPTFQPDADGVIRRFDDLVLAGLGADSELAPYATVTHALTTPDCGSRVHGESPSSKSKKLNFGARSQIRRFDAETILEAAQDPDSAYSRGLGLGNAIVIIGGFYRYARDEYVTPVGQLFGAEIIANAIKGPPITEASPLLSLAVEVAVEVILLALVISLNLRLPWALLCSSLLSATAAFLLSWELFNFGGYFLGVFGALAGVVLGVIAEVVWEPLLEEWRRWKRGFVQVAKGRQ
jgi:CHASE2 domain-containing sensor protein